MPKATNFINKYIFLLQRTSPTKNMIEVWVYTSATWKNQSKTESVGMWRETMKELNPSWDVSQKKNLATHMVNTRRRPKYACSRCEEARMQMAKVDSDLLEHSVRVSSVLPFQPSRLTFTCAWAHRTTSFLDRASLPLRHWMACSASCPGKGRMLAKNSNASLAVCISQGRTSFDGCNPNQTAFDKQLAKGVQ